MPATYTLISSNVLTSSAASVTFSSIPATYTDLVLKLSMRNTAAGSWTSEVFYNFNSDTTSTQSNTRLLGTGAAASSSRSSSQTKLYNDFNGIPSAGETANTFANSEIYIPSYTVSQSKPIVGFSVSESNVANPVYMALMANLFQNNAAVSSITFSMRAGSTFDIGSSFYLYGISNA